MEYVWFHGWAGRSGRGELGLGVRHPVDDGAGFYYPWINAPPGKIQRLGVFFMLSDGPPDAALEDVLRFTKLRPISVSPRIQNPNLPLALGLHNSSP
jgi:hypothetical protein